MSKNKKKNRGLRIGAYRITPLGLGVLIVLVLAIAAAAVLIFANPFGHEGGSYYTRLTATPTPEPTPTPTPTPAPTPEPTPEPTPRAATIRSLGEIAVQTNVLEAAKTDDGSYDFSEMFTYISDIVGDADFTVADVEGSMGDTLEAKGDGQQMLTPSSIITALKDSGVDMLTLANDHALDGNLADLLASIENLNDAGMLYVGGAASQTERDTAKIVTINDINVGFVAYTDSLNGLETKVDADALKYGINYVASCNAKTDIQALKDAGADVIVAYMSWGEMLNRETTSMQLELAKQLVMCGVDVIIGYNPHVIQAANWIEMKDANGNVAQRTLCLGATGNFLSDSREQYSDSGVIFEFTIQEKEDMSGFEIVNPVYIPTYVWRIENEDGSYDYRTIAAGQWLETAPEGMNYSQFSRVKAVWAEAQSIMGSNVATVSAE